MAWRDMFSKALAALAFGVGCLFFSPPTQAGTIAYKYDPLGRLIATLYPSPSGLCALYAYDPAGNRSQFAAAVGAAPIAATITTAAFENASATFDPRASDPACASLTISSAGTPSAPAHGAASVVENSTAITYTPNTGYTGPDSFSYAISDGVHPPQTGVVKINVSANLLGPTALPTGIVNVIHLQPGHSVTPSATGNIGPSISDPFGYSPAIVSVSNGAYGMAGFSGALVSYTYGSQVSQDTTIHDRFTYTVSDGQGNAASSTVNVSIVVIVNQ